ncbi:SH3 domain-containing protein [Bacillus tianshenii]|uniref:SH3 domain-containing protein n=1 Tax=Sutcliffiella tianshenii TaxID=1463404 RepID=UPI001CD3627A|nr:SH3 domain-containing protein [Bacillus tianshenii]MCA1318798.1 SH3 domain-containing protein [Bacillus tianshenii]
MLQKLHILAIGLLLFSTVFASVHIPSAHADGTIEVSTDVLNVRDKPDANSLVISKVLRGETYPVVDTKGEWIKIQVTSSKAGWVASYLVTDKQGSASPAGNSESTDGVQVLTDDLRVRSGPGTSFNVIGFVQSTDSVSFLDQNENWVKIRTSGLEGWVSSEFVSIQTKKKKKKETTDSQEQENESTPRSATIITDGLNIRSEPSTQSKVLGTLSNGTVVDVLSQKSGWLKISFEGETGWIHSDYADLHTDSGNEAPSKKKGSSSATISVSGLNVRNEPNLNGKIIDQISQGTDVTIISERNNWCEIEYANGNTGWVAGWFLERKSLSANPGNGNVTGDGSIIILDNGTNIRSEPSTTAKVVYRANEGETFSIKGLENDWYKIELSDGTTAYVAGWIVTTKGQSPTITRAGSEQYLRNKVIVIDPGHGGKDVGAIGVQGTYEKDLTLRTSRLLQDKLKAAGATVYLTRQNDSFVSLPARARTANHHGADVFISVHYDSIEDSSVTGTTTFYYGGADQQLADSVHQSLIQLTNLRDRNVRQENYLVLRENMQPSLLLELGYISNRGEELTILSSDFQERAATGIYQGLAHYFRDR